MPIDPNLIAAIAASGVQPPEPSADPEVQRTRAYEFDKAVYPHLGPVKPHVHEREHVVPVDGYPDVLVRLYYPSTPAADLNLPMSLFFFGGAFCQGGLHFPSVDAMCAQRASRAQVIVAAVSYALAPEHPFPTQLEQGYAALDWLVREAESLGADKTRIALWGQSSGANLSAALTQVNRERAQHPLAMQILEVPVLDLTLDPAERDMSEVRDEELAGLEAVMRWYVPRNEDRLDPRVSPLRAKDFSDLPPAYIFTAECDPLRHDGEAYAAALADAGVHVAAMRILGLPHNGGIFERASLAARTLGTTVVEALRTLHN